MTLFSFLHLTDLHFCQEPLRKYAPQLLKRSWNEIIDTIGEQRRDLGLSSFFLPASYDPEIAKGVAQFCYDWSGAVDGIIITGDLATTGLTVDIKVAEQFIKQPAFSGFLSADRFPTLASLELPIHLFPGNHDRYINNFGKPGSNYFDFVFDSYMDKNKKSKFVGSWVSEKEEVQLAFVHADFCLRARSGASFPRRYMSYGQGRVYDDVLEDLKNETVAIRSELGQVHVVWLVHFAPYDCGTASLRLIDHQKLLDAAEALDVRVTICGHTHQARVTSLTKQTIYCGGSSCCVDNVGGCMVHVIDFTIDESFRVARSTFVWDENGCEFVHLKND
jgi:Icc-related predicted phosphoesterase